LTNALRIEKKKWDASIVAAVHIGIFCEKLDHPITRSELENEIFKISDLPYTTIEKIWRTIPDKYRKSAGRPKKQ
jgi:hypothetical protein